jgi:hypothetical protein
MPPPLTLTDVAAGSDAGLGAGCAAGPSLRGACTCAEVCGAAGGGAAGGGADGAEGAWGETDPAVGGAAGDMDLSTHSPVAVQVWLSAHAGLQADTHWFWTHR